MKVIKLNAEKLQSYQNSMEHLITGKKGLANAQKSEPTLKQNLYIGKNMLQDSHNISNQRAAAGGGTSLNDHTRPFSGN